VRSLGALRRQAERLARPLSAAALPVRSEALAAARPGADGYLAPADAFAVLEEIGVPVAPWRLVAGPTELAAAAAAVGFPVVLKAVGERLLHKSEMGAVVVGLRDTDELAAAAAAMSARLEAHGVRPEGFLVQRQVSGWRETIVGITRDPAAGPLVMCGLGGVAVEVWKDVSFRVAPVDRGEALAMVDSLRGAPLLGAFRGRRPADRAALAAAIARLGALAAAHPELAECDVNPLLVGDDGDGCVAVDVRLRVGA
jgi:acyl-CoA synthetase (NDP forming)